MSRASQIRILDGRMSMQFHDLAGSAPGTTERLKTVLDRLPGVRSVFVGRHSGMVIVDFTPESLGADRILQALGLDPTSALAPEAQVAPASSPPSG